MTISTTVSAVYNTLAIRAVPFLLLKLFTYDARA